MRLAKRLKPRLLILVLIVTFLVSVAPTILRTVAWASNGPDLARLAFYSDDILSYNPWGISTVIMSGDFAFWILENFDWPYQNRTSTEPPFFGPPEYGPMPYVLLPIFFRYEFPEYVMQDSRVTRVLKAFLQHSEPVNERYAGGTALQLAVLSGDDDSVKTLLEYGADPSAKIRSERHRFYDMNCFEVAESLYQEVGADYASTYQLVMSAR